MEGSSPALPDELVNNPEAKKRIDDTNDDIERILGIFLCNDINGALGEIEPKLSSHYYYHVIKAVFISLNGMITFDEDSLTQALEVIQVSLKEVSMNRRKKASFITSLWTSINYDDWSEDEVYAELSHVILSAYNTLMILATEKTLSGLVKAGYYAKACMSTLRECDSIQAQRTKWSSARTRLNFEHAVFLGHGLFGMVISMSPPRVLRILSYFGYHFDRKKSLEQLENIAFGSSVWSPISALALLGFHLEIQFIACLGDCDLSLTEKLLCINRKRYPGSGFFLMFEGIHEQIKGDLGKANELICKSRDCFKQWIEWQNACDWLLVWIHSIQRNWLDAEECIKTLKDKCSWSPCCFTYIHAAIKQMMADDLTLEHASLETVNSDTTPVQVQIEKLRHEVNELLELAPKLKNSMAGKTIYFEKFVTKRCEIFEKEKKLDPNSSLILPMLEQLFFWNVFSMSSNSPHLLSSFVQMIDAKIQQMELPNLVSCSNAGISNEKIPNEKISNEKISNEKISNEKISNGRSPTKDRRRSSSRKASNLAPDADNNNSIDEKYLYLITMKGICYHYMKQTHEQEAQALLSFVVENQSNLNLYQHLAPLACLELGIMYSKSNDETDLDIAIKYLNAATNQYKQYLNETMVHMRASAALNLIKDKRKIRKQSLELKRSQSAVDANARVQESRKDSFDSCHSVT